MTGDIVIKRKTSKESLAEFSVTCGEALALRSVEERFSDNYATGHYFRARSLGIAMTIEDADAAEFSDYDFWITFSASRGTRHEATLEGIADLVTIELSILGYDVVRVVSSRDLIDGIWTSQRKRVVRRLGETPEYVLE